MCLVYSMLSVSIDCPFVVAPLVFSNVYLGKNVHNLYLKTYVNKFSIYFLTFAKFSVFRHH